MGALMATEGMSCSLKTTKSSANLGLMDAPVFGMKVNTVFVGSALTLVKSTCWKKVPWSPPGLRP